MIRVSATRAIPAKAQLLFDLLDKPETHRQITPALVESREIGRLPSGGTHASYLYRILGIPFAGEIRAVEHDRPGKLRYEMTGAIRGSIEIVIKDESEGATVSYTGAFDLKPRSLVFLGRPILGWYNRRQIRSLLANLERLATA